MTINQFEGFYLGTISDLDPNETTYTTDNASALIGQVVGLSSAPLYQYITTIGMNDANDDGMILENDNGAAAEQIIYGGVGQDLDSVTDYNVTITFLNGTVATTQMEILQDTSGRVFLAPYQTGRTANDVLDDYPIQSITFDSIVSSSFYATPSNPEADAFITCFRAGSLIETPQGPVDVARLRVGDIVRTEDAGGQPILWIDVTHGRATGKSAPVRFAPGAMGADMPDRALYLTRQHRVLLRSPIAERIAGRAEVLVAAKDLVGLPGITLEETGEEVVYFHLLLPAHHLITAHNMLSESLLSGPMVQDRLPAELRANPGGTTPARPIVRGAKCRALLHRHLKNAKVLVAAAPGTRQPVTV